MRRSRRYTNNKSKATRSLMFYIFASLFSLVFIGFVGFQLLINFSLLLDKVRVEEAASANQPKEEILFLSPPRFDIPYLATSSSTLNFAGQVEEGEFVELYLNDKSINKTKVKNSVFQFKNIKLNEGVNKIKTRVLMKDLKSNFSDVVTIQYRKSEPKLEINSPNQGDIFTGSQITLKVSGKTESYAVVSINGSRAIIDDEGNFKYDYRMQNGENTLNFIAIDDVGNKIEKEVKFSYSP